jgi:hypothetical protein
LNNLNNYFIGFLALYNSKEGKIIGNTVSWTMKCRGKEGTTIMNGRITYKGDRFDGEIKMKTPNGMEMTQHISGKRIGECK